VIIKISPDNSLVVAGDALGNLLVYTINGKYIRTIERVYDRICGI
jgi:hypothetical protein